MTQQPIALLELALVGGLGAILFITGILIKTLTDRKNSRCTSKTVGKVIRHSFMGDGRIAPVVEYEAGGTKYTCKKDLLGLKKYIAQGWMNLRHGKTKRDTFMFGLES